MLLLLEAGARGRRLRELLQRFREQEHVMAAALRDLQAELERQHREASYVQLATPEEARSLVRLCAEMQQECDLLAIELVHVRMAVAGTSEELAGHEQDADTDLVA